MTGAKLRATALRLFARHGYAAVSMRQIAAEVGVQVGALYNHIPDKQSLLFSLMRDHMDALLAAVDADLAGVSTGRLERFVRFHIAFHHARQDAVFISYMELRNLSAENFATLEALRQRYEAVLQALLHEGQRAGEVHLTNTKVATRAIIAMLTGVSTWFREDGDLSLSDVQDIYWDMVQGIVRTRG